MKLLRPVSGSSEKVRYRSKLRGILTVRQLLRLLSLLALTFIGLSVKPAEGTDSTEWSLVQMKDSDEIRVFLTPNAVKLVSVNSEYQIVMKAPNWQVSVFQSDQKKIWLGVLQEFNSSAIYNPLSKKMGARRVALKETSRENLGGLRIVNFKTMDSYEGNLTVSEDIHVPPQIAELLSRYYGSPYVDKVPLHWQFKAMRNGASTRSNNLLRTNARWLDYDQFSDRRSGLQIDLTTKSCKRTPYRASDFAVPVGYVRVPKLRDVCLSSKQRQSIESILDELGSDSERKK